MVRRLQLIRYLIFDFISAAVSWTLFFSFRKTVIEQSVDISAVYSTFDQRFYLSLILIPHFWLLLYYLSGYYNDIFRKSRFTELGQTLLISFIGSIVIFFALLLNDVISSYTQYYYLFSGLFFIHFILTYIPRLIITSISIRKIRKGIICFNSLLIGSNTRARETYLEVENQSKATGDKIVGYINVNGDHETELSKYIPCLGHISVVAKVIAEHKIEEVIIAVESSEHEKINNIINHLAMYNINIKIIPDMYDILTGSVRMFSIYGTPLIQVSKNVMPEWQKSVKQALDLLIAFCALLLFLPVGILLAIIIKITSCGPVIYSHYRVGQHGKPFRIYKFRSMYCDAEKNGPELATRHDARITLIGRFMRRTKLDELPNFINVLRGDMSIVGPRPERQYYIDQIICKAPQYQLLYRVKPGITSLGQVKFGYAENVDQMISRLRYDLLYIEHMSLFLDFKIMAYTITTILRGKGI